MRKGVLSSWEAQYIACMNKANFAENMKFKRPLVLWHREFQRKIEFINPKLQKRFSELSTLNHQTFKQQSSDFESRVPHDSITKMFLKRNPGIVIALMVISGALMSKQMQCIQSGRGHC